METFLALRHYLEKNTFSYLLITFCSIPILFPFLLNLDSFSSPAFSRLLVFLYYSACILIATFSIWSACIELAFYGEVNRSHSGAPPSGPIWLFIGGVLLLIFLFVVWYMRRSTKNVGAWMWLPNIGWIISFIALVVSSKTDLISDYRLDLGISSGIDTTIKQLVDVFHRESLFNGSPKDFVLINAISRRGEVEESIKDSVQISFVDGVFSSANVRDESSNELVKFQVSLKVGGEGLPLGQLGDPNGWVIKGDHLEKKWPNKSMKGKFDIETLCLCIGNKQDNSAKFLVKQVDCTLTQRQGTPPKQS